MSEFMFGVSRQKPIRRVAKQMEKIAGRHDAYLIETRLPGTGYQRWFAARNMGEPFDRRRAEAVHGDLVTAGIEIPTPSGYELAEHARASRSSR